jgi:3-hydroxypropanoate dehydrogenase
VSAPLSPEALDALFSSARTHRARLNHPVSDDALRKLCDLLRMGPTSTDCCPGRFVFVRSKEAKHRLAPAINPPNIDRTMTAPVTVIVATDTRYHEHLPQLWPHDEAPRLKIVNALCLGDEGIPQWHVAGRLFDYRGPCPGIRLGTAVGLQ